MFCGPSTPSATTYIRHEPTSPVPLLLQRGKRLVTMSFMDILHDLLPDSIQTMQKITGKIGPLKPATQDRP